MTPTPQAEQELRSDIENIVFAARQTSQIRQAEIEFLIMEFGIEMGVTKEIHSNGQVRYRLRNSDKAPGVWISQEQAYEIVARDVLNRIGYYVCLETR